MAERDQKELLPAGRKRRVPKREVIGARVAKMLARGLKPRVEGVTPLNPGFFALEQLRARNAVKAKSVQRKTVKGK